MSTTYTPHVILITGGAGFIASHVVIHFVTKYPQYQIVNVDKLDYCSSLKNLEEIENAPNYKFYIADITDPHTMQKIFDMEHVDTVLHFAAQTHVDNSFGNSFQFTHNNIYGTHVLCEVAKNSKVKRFIHVSTDEVYGQVIGNAATENSLLNPTNPYSATKAGAEFIAKAYYQSFGLPLIITRGNNVYGPHQFPEKLIPKFITLLDRGLNCSIHGSGEEKRSFIFISDVVAAFDLILREGVIGETYNIGTDREISNLEVAQHLLNIFAVPKADQEGRIYHVENRCFNDQRYTLDISKLKALGWAPTVGFEEGLKLTVDWYLSHKKNWERTDEALVPHPRFGQ
ncbi:DTDP-glucose 4,6-dehydratase, putative [Entamoeba invadens IP1]|uniref:DTDP-glucose 4,6-dehydratase, putative n=1 Tax=Entamoeba invadens IP1 TaxID=370355 RepID=UPI0002C3E5A9|nr:DTDP-glucose 4,6-dehydratase, putative [Entamoeba invadens IP1]ELP85275.1 DTDP-glucose 4,6-dehydratase, putative [Entamoeba invadens IP1]|eukprot:XP_004184621.1 DTDP-glucose 4,6-dehydratase, putative [Entamoeba invadens IP1]